MYSAGSFPLRLLAGSFRAVWPERGIDLGYGAAFAGALARPGDHQQNLANLLATA
jgi:hypothetical protein